MSSSSKQEVNLNLQNVRFFNNTKLGTVNDFSTDVRFRKRVRVDGDFYTSGRIPYTDKQTGWGEPEWTFAQTGVYSVKTDSLIHKITTIEQNYATKQYVDSIVSGGTAAQGLIFYDTEQYGQYADPTQHYPYPVTTLVQNSAFIFRDTQSTQMHLKFQKGAPGIGKVLTCQDTDGTVGWAEVSTQTSVISDTISSTHGQSNSFTFRVIDIGVSGTSPSVGWSFYPQVASNTFNKALLANDICLIGGVNGAPSDRRLFIGPYSNGSEGIVFKSAYSTTSNGITTNFFGKTRISGGYYDAGTGREQTIQLDSQGIIMQPGLNMPVVIELPKTTLNLSTSTWSKPLIAQGKWGNDQFPTLVCSKSNTDGTENHGIHFNPKLGAGNWNSMVQAGDMGIISGDYTSYDPLGSAPITEVIYRFFIGPWSYYMDGISIRPSLTSEETAITKPATSGYVRICAAANYIGSNNVDKYFEVNRDGLTLKNSVSTKTSNYGRFDVLNKTGTILNSTSTEQVAGSFNVGTSTSTCVSQFNGDVTIQNGNIKLLPLSNPTAPNYVLTSVDSSGKAIWSPLPTIYSVMTVTNLTATNFSAAQWTSGSSTLYQSGGGVMYYDNNFNGGRHTFAVNDSLGTQYTPFSIYPDRVAVEKPLQFSDGTQQSSGYTGAKSMAGSYTNTSMTIDSNGKITAISSNPLDFPTSISTPFTFTSTVSHTDSIFLYPPSGTIKSLDLGPNTQFYVNGDSFFSRTPYIKSGGVANLLLQSVGNEVGQTVWSNSLNISNFIIPNVAETSTTNNVTYSMTNSVQALNMFATTTTGQGVSTFTPSRNTIYYWSSNNTIGSAQYPSQRHLVQEFIVTIQWQQSWTFLQNKQANDELMSINIELTFYYIAVINNQNVEVERWRVDIPNPTSSNIYVQRYRSSTSYCQYSATRFPTEIPLATIKFLWAPPFGDTTQYRFSLLCYGQWSNSGEFIQFTSTPSVEVNYTSNVEVYGIVPSASDIYATQALYNTFRYNCTGMTNNGNTVIPYEYPGLGSITLFPLKQSTPNTISTFLSFGNIDVTTLTVHSALYLPNSPLYATGIAARRGGATDSNLISPYDTTDNVKGSTKCWGNLFNFWWTGSKWQIWVDFSLIYEGGINVSDYRRKSNVRPIENVLDRIVSLPVIQYTLDEYEVIQKTDNHVGVFAHELQELFPECDQLVNGEKDAVDSNGKPILQTISNELVFLLVKSIQELKAESDRMKEEKKQLEQKIEELHFLFTQVQEQLFTLSIPPK